MDEQKYPTSLLQRTGHGQEKDSVLAPVTKPPHTSLGKHCIPTSSNPARSRPQHNLAQAEQSRRGNGKPFRANRVEVRWTSSSWGAARGREGRWRLEVNLVAAVYPVRWKGCMHTMRESANWVTRCDLPRLNNRERSTCDEASNCVQGLESYLRPLEGGQTTLSTNATAGD